MGLLQLNLERTRIDLCEKIPFMDELAFLERDANELAIHAAADRDRVKRRHGT